MRKRILLSIFVGCALFAPYLIIGFGPLEVNYVAILFGLIACLSALLIIIGERIATWFQSAILILVSVSLTLTVFDLVSRPLLKSLLYYRPHELFFGLWPDEPTLYRYEERVKFQGQAYGDLAAFSGRKEYRRPRKMVFMTDDRGFRNDPGVVKDPAEILVLGDSFGLGLGTTQERTWPCLLRDKYGLKVYNLSVPGSPRDQLVNLKVELPGLKKTSGALLLWTIFAGNDLDEYYVPTLSPRFVDAGTARIIRLHNFREKSPTKKLFRALSGRPHEDGTPSDVIVRRTPDGAPLLFYGPYYQRACRSEREVAGHPNFPGFVAIFKEMKAVADSNGLRVMVVVFPSKSEVYDWIVRKDKEMPASNAGGRFAALVGRLSVHADFEFLDLTPILRREAKKLFKDSGEFLWWRDDTHLNEAGEELAAEAIFTAVGRGNVKHPG